MGFLSNLFGDGGGQGDGVSLIAYLIGMSLLHLSSFS